MNDEEYLRLNDQGLAEINPMASYNAQNQFIDNYRNIQAENTAQIGTQAHALGSDLAAPQGGLHGPSSYWRSRYQTPQTESRVAELRANNQAQALNQLMQNDLAREQEKYNQAARAANQRANSGGNNNTSDYDATQGKVNFTSLESLGRAGTVQPGISTVYDAATGQPTNTTVIPADFGNAAIDESGNVRANVIDNASNTVVDTTDVDTGSDVGYLGAANKWARSEGYSSWADYIAKHTDEAGNVNIPFGRPSDIHQFDLGVYAMGY